MTMREARVSKGWSQDRLGVEAGGIGQNRISQIERGSAPPPKLKEAEGIAKALGYPLGELFSGMMKSVPDLDKYPDPAPPPWPSSEEIKARIGETESIPVPPLAKPAEKYSQNIPADPVAEFYKTVDQLRGKVEHCIRCLDKAMQVVTRFGDYVAEKGGEGDAV